METIIRPNKRVYDALNYNDFQYFDNEQEVLSSLNIDWEGPGFYRTTKLYGKIWGNYKLAISEKEFQELTIDRVVELTNPKGSKGYEVIKEEWEKHGHGNTFYEYLCKYSLSDFITKTRDDFDKKFRNG